MRYQLVDVKTAAELIQPKISRRKIASMCEHGDIKAVLLGSGWIIPYTEILRLNLARKLSKHVAAWHERGKITKERNQKKSDKSKNPCTKNRTK